MHFYLKAALQESALLNFD